MYTPEVILITGAGRGIGREIALSASLPGNIIALLDISRQELERTAEDCAGRGAKIIYECINVSDSTGVNRFCQQVAHMHGGFTAVFVNAGVGPTQVPASLRGVEDLVAVNYLGAVYTISAVLELQAKLPSTDRLSIIGIGSISALVSSQSSGGYSASKAALTRYLDSLRLRYDPKTVRIVEVTVGFVATAMTEGLTWLGPLLEKDVALVGGKIARFRHGSRSRYSVPFFRNQIWWLLAASPRPLRERLMRSIFERIVRPRLE